MITITFVAFMCIMGFGFFILWDKLSYSDPQGKKELEIVDKEKTDDGYILRPRYSLDTFIVNLADKD